jgi:Ca2+-binding RTX toxin-like protein
VCLLSIVALTTSLVAMVTGASPALASNGSSSTEVEIFYDNLTYGDTAYFVAFVYDESASCDAVVPSCDTPTGHVDFYDEINGSSTFLERWPLEYLSSKIATTVGYVEWCCLVAGVHTIRAVYVPSGEEAFDASTGSTTQTILQATTGTVVTQSAESTTLGEPVTFTAKVRVGLVGPGAVAAPTGQVRFYDNGGSFGGPVDLAGDTAVLTYSNLPVGTHTITARYMGDINYSESFSHLTGGLTHTVGPAKQASVTSMASSPNPSGSGQGVTLTAMVTPSGSGTPTGTVTFRDGVTLLGSGSLAGGEATATTSALNPGTHVITATYGGDASFGPSTSPAVSHTVLACTITASPGGVTTGTPGDDVICGSATGDDLGGGGGRDVLLGGGGNDRLSGGDGDDKLVGGDGDDQLVGGAGDDTLVGDGGTDVAAGGTGSDACLAETRAQCER